MEEEAETLAELEVLLTVEVEDKRRAGGEALQGVEGVRGEGTVEVSKVPARVRMISTMKVTTMTTMTMTRWRATMTDCRLSRSTQRKERRLQVCGRSPRPGKVRVHLQVSPRPLLINLTMW